MLYTGEAEYETIAAIKQAVRIPIIANGDVHSPQKAREVLDATGADALMIGRAAQGRPWIFREISHYLATGEHLPLPEVAEIHRVLKPGRHMALYVSDSYVHGQGQGGFHPIGFKLFERLRKVGFEPLAITYRFVKSLA